MSSSLAEITRKSRAFAEASRLRAEALDVVLQETRAALMEGVARQERQKYLLEPSLAEAVSLVDLVEL
jgi:hypothetical protein